MNMARTRVRLAALLVVGVLVAPAMTECAGWASSAAGRHACCANRGDMAPETSMTDCCSMSNQSTEGAPTDAQPIRPSLKLLGPQFTHLSDIFSPPRSTLFVDWAIAQRAACVPLYLRQASLLI